jgi:hypothetical protein
MIGTRGRTPEERERVGTNKLYSAAIDRRMGEHVNEVVMRDKSPQSLTDIELELDNFPLTRTPKPLPVKAWIHYGEIAIKVDARAVAWTARAVAVEWDAPGGSHHAWVWASAVEGR